MKKKILSLLVFLPLIVGCGKEHVNNEIIFATSSMYPPFEYLQHGELKGFDIELAKLIAGKLHKTAKFVDLQFGSILPALYSKQVDAAIATITVTEKRKQNFDFSQPYLFEKIASVYRYDVGSSDLHGKKVACQLGTTMQYWAENNLHDSQIIAYDSTNQAVESLKSNHVDAVLLDAPQAKAFVDANSQLKYSIIATSDNGYGIAVHKNSPLLGVINKALQEIKNENALQKLEAKWLGD